MKKNIGLLIIFIGGLGLGLLLGSEFSGSYITIIGAILLLFTIISIILLSYNKKVKDNDLSPGSKTYEEIGEITEMIYYAPDKKKGKDKVK